MLGRLETPRTEIITLYQKKMGFFKTPIQVLIPEVVPLFSRKIYSVETLHNTKWTVSICVLIRDFFMDITYPDTKLAVGRSVRLYTVPYFRTIGKT